MIPTRIAAASIAALALIGSLVIPAAANAASPTATVMVKTQRMSDATLSSTQNGWYNKGSKLSLVCFKRGQSVKGYFSPYISGGWDNLWYKVSDGYFVADVDIDTGSNNPVTGECPPPPSTKIDTNQWYVITNTNSGKVIDARGGASGNGTAIQQYSANSTASQSFRFVAVSGGYYKVVSKLNSAQGWDVSGKKTSNGAKVQLWKYGGGTNQEWKVTFSGSTVTFQPRHASAKCLDVPGGSKNNSVQLQIYSCNGTGAQKFTLTAKGAVSVPGRYIVPFAVGETWYVCQGYNGTPSHRGDIALDITFESSRGKDGCWGNPNASSGKTVYAPISGRLQPVSSALGGVCITPTSGGGSIYLGHLTSIGGARDVKAGDAIAKVAPAGSAGNNGYAHVHLSARSGAGCGGSKVPFDDAHNSRIIGLENMASSGAANQWAGTKLRR